MNVKMKTNTWKLKDVILMAVFGVVFAAVYLAVFYVGTAVSVALTPMGLSAFGFELIYGIWFMASTMSAYILRKPGVALITEVLAATVELLMGNAGGLAVVLTGFIQGLGAEIIFMMFRYKKWNLLTMSLSGMMAAIFIFGYELYYLNYYLLSPSVLIAQLSVRFISAVVFSGVVAKLTGDALAKTGVLRSYAIGETVKMNKVYSSEEEDV